MKKILTFFILTALSCHTEKKPAEKFPSDDTRTGWTTYEGRVPLSETRNLYLEVSMLPSALLGEGDFRLLEFLEDANLQVILSETHGQYTTIYDGDSNDLIIHFHNSAQAKGIRRSYISTASPTYFTDADVKVIREESFRNTDLVLKTQGKNKLVVLDARLKPVTLEAQYNLLKRTSKLFTVEGYFRHSGDTADFLEMNTGEKWAISKLGAYEQATRQYHQLVKEKWEVTYLKAVGYSVSHVGSVEKETDALVLKTILQMTSSPSLTEEYRRRSQH
jgi:hypothetical protein